MFLCVIISRYIALVHYKADLVSGDLTELIYIKSMNAVLCKYWSVIRNTFLTSFPLIFEAGRICPLFLHIAQALQ